MWWRNVLAATLRNLARNRLYAAISIGGLAIGMAAALLTGLFVRDELTFDHFIPGYRSLFVVGNRFDSPGINEMASLTPAKVAGLMKLEFPQLHQITRYMPSEAVIGRGEVEANEKVGFVDPDFFDVLPLKVVAGDLNTAVARPDAVVLTRAMARKYFGADAPLGRPLLLNRKTPLTVTAVIEDLPGASTLATRIFVAGGAAGSPLAEFDLHPPPPDTYLATVRTYVRLNDPIQVAAVNRAFPDFVRRRVFTPEIQAKSAFARGVKLSLIPVAGQHLLLDRASEVPSGDPAALYALSIIALLILVVAGINFVNLMTARAGRRAVEVGVRKAAGANRRALVLQFIGESVVYAAVGLVAALSLVELALPQLNALLDRQIVLSFWQDPLFLAGALGLALLLGVAGGVYPALVLSGFRPAEVLKGPPVRAGGSALVRRLLVTLQFAVLIGLLLSVAVIESQTRFAMTKAISLNTDRVLRVYVRCTVRGQDAERALVDRIRTLPGVASVACSAPNAAGGGGMRTDVILPGGKRMIASYAPIQFGFFELYGVRPVAGRLPSPDRGGDLAPSDPNAPPALHFPPNGVVNQSMVRAMGLNSPQDALGHTFRAEVDEGKSEPVTIVGVVPDVVFDLTRKLPVPAFYSVIPRMSQLMSIKLAAGRIPETLSAIDRVWRQAGDPKPITRTFTDDYLKTLYVGVIRQGALVGGLAAITVFIGGLGLFGLAAFTAEQRTKEIGVRKAMGASGPDIARLLLWSFTQPVLWANLIAWPAAWWAMSRWLQGFTQRIDLSPIYFLAAGAAALAIAALTVSTHAIRVARAQPVGALRYE